MEGQRRAVVLLHLEGQLDAFEPARPPLDRVERRATPWRRHYGLRHAEELAAIAVEMAGRVEGGDDPLLRGSAF